MEGNLYKWTNYVFQWQLRHFNLKSGILTYSKSINSTQLGVIHLNVSHIFKHPTNNLRLYIDTGLTIIHLKASNHNEASLWYEALIAGKENSQKYSQKNMVINLISEKIAEINSVHAQVLAEIDVLPISVIKITPGLERAIWLCGEMKDLASETLGYIESQEESLVRTEEVEGEAERGLGIGYEDDFVDAKSKLSEIEEEV